MARCILLHDWNFTYGVSGINTGIDDIGTSARTSTVVVDIGGAATGLVRNAAQAPGGTSLLDKSVQLDNGILLNVLNLYKNFVSICIFPLRFNLTALYSHQDGYEEPQVSLCPAFRRNRGKHARRRGGRWQQGRSEPRQQPEGSCPP